MSKRGKIKQEEVGAAEIDQGEQLGGQETTVCSRLPEMAKDALSLTKESRPLHGRKKKDTEQLKGTNQLKP